MAALTGKMESETEIKASADNFFRIFRSQAHHIPNISSDKIHKIELHQGDWEGTHGSIKHWTYTIGGKCKSIREKVESIDEENRSITFKVLEGELLSEYKSYKFTVQAIPKGGEEGGAGCLVKWTAEYEKAREDVPDPHDYLHLAILITKDIDAHLVNAGAGAGAAQ